MSVTAIIPAYNEEKTLPQVLSGIAHCPDIYEIIVVDDGSWDRTSEVATQFGARVVRTEHQGKGAALYAGASAAKSELVLFLDADLKGFECRHVSRLLEPVCSGKAAMSVGLRDRGFGFSVWLPLLPLIGGERAMMRATFLALYEHAGSEARSFGIETVMNAYCRANHLSIVTVPLPGVTQVTKEQKYGLCTGGIARMCMIWHILDAEVRTVMSMIRSRLK